MYQVLPDYIVPPPAMPGANVEAIWIDTKDGGYTSRSGLLGTVKFDQAVTLYVRKASLGAADGDLIIVNNGGAGDVLPANIPHEIKVYFGGARTQVALKPADTCAVWHVDGRITSRPVL